MSGQRRAAPAPTAHEREGAAAAVRQYFVRRCAILLLDLNEAAVEGQTIAAAAPIHG
jgi:hypothetical protein